MDNGSKLGEITVFHTFLTDKKFRNKNANPPEIIHENVLEKIRDKELLFREKLNLPKVCIE